MNSQQTQVFQSDNNQEQQNQQQLIEKKVKEHDYGVGLQLLQKLGFKYGQGLGINRQEPVIPIKKQVFTGTLLNHNKENEEVQAWLYDQDYENKNSRKLDKIWRKRNQIDMYQDSQLLNQINSINNINLGEGQELTQSVQHLLHK